MSAAVFQESDVTAVREYLSSFDLFAGNEAEGESYLNLALQRFLITLSLIPPASKPGMKLLELGGNPYFLTLLIKKFRDYDITLANYFGTAGPASGRGKQVVRSERYDETHEFEYDHFNGEIDEFPYRDHTFDVVLNCEILEHLTLDPTVYLYECHRVLKPGGALILTTPNVLAFQNLWRLGASRNVYDLYSGYGVYGRHNREYTPRELVNLAEGCGFTLEQVKIADIYPSRGLTRWLKRFHSHWRDNLFLVVRSQGRPQYYYPAWLYRSMGSLRYVRRPDIMMGDNDIVQLGEGWHAPDSASYTERWTRGGAVAYLRGRPEYDRLLLTVNAARPMPGEVTLTVHFVGATPSRSLPASGWRELTCPVPEGLAGEVAVTLSVSPVYNSRQHGVSEDGRELGVLMRQMSLYPSQ